MEAVGAMGCRVHWTVQLRTSGFMGAAGSLLSGEVGGWDSFRVVLRTVS